MKRLFVACLAICAALPLEAASAATITFDAIGGGPNFWAGASYTEGGLAFTGTSPAGGANALASWAVYDTSNNADPNGRTIFSNYWGYELSFSPTGGGIFDLGSLDLADVYNDGQPSLIDYSYVLGGVTTFGQFSLDNVQGLQTFALNLQGISSFSIEQSAPSGFQLDNVRLDLTGAVPEPTTWAMMLLGFGLIGGAMRARRRPVLNISHA